MCFSSRRGGASAASGRARSPIPAGEPGGLLRRDHLLQHRRRSWREGRVTERGAPREERLLGLHHRMQEAHGPVPALARRLVLERLQQPDGNRAARRGEAHRDEPISAVAPLDRRALADPVAREVAGSEDTAVVLRGARDPLGKRPAVERVGIPAEEPERAGELAAHDPVARRRRRGTAVGAADEQLACRRGTGGEALEARARRGGVPRGRAEAVFGEPGRRRDERRERPSSEAARELRVTLHRAGHRHREPAIEGAGRSAPCVSVRREHVRRRRRGRDLAEVERVHLPVARRVDEREAPAADPGRLRLDDGEGERRRHGGVGGAPAAAQHLRRDLARERVCGRHRAPAGDGGRGEDEREEDRHPPPVPSAAAFPGRLGLIPTPGRA